jgi:hypothetical protein
MISLADRSGSHHTWALIDSDIELRYRYCARGVDRYAVRNAETHAGRRLRQLAADILDIPVVQSIGRRDTLVPDHINCDRLDNRRCNLRAVTFSQNASAYSGTPGVTYNPRQGPWWARICVGGTSVFLGTHPTEGDAVAARKAAEALIADGVDPRDLLPRLRAA